MSPQPEDYHASRSLITSAVRDVLGPSELGAIFTLLSSGLYCLSLCTVLSSSRHAVLCCTLSLSPPVLSSPYSTPLYDTNSCLYFAGDVIWYAVVLLVEASLRRRAIGR